METRTIAVMLTDIKGFTSKTAGFSRAQTHELLTRHRELVLPVIQKFRGRLVKTIGDAFLVAFDSPTDAVLCGVEIQCVLRAYNGDKPQSEKIEIRIAINSGEVAIQDDGDIYGDAVNITSRLESITEAGEVFFTEAVYLAMNKKEVPSSEIGYRQFKGVAERIKVYRVLREVPVGELGKEVEAEPGQEKNGTAAQDASAQAAAQAGAPAQTASSAAFHAPAVRMRTRILAFLIDGFIFVTLAKTMGLPFKMLIWALYGSLFVWRFGATPGKMILKLKVVDAATGVKPPTDKAFLRGFFSVISVFLLLGYFWAIWEKDKRTWHDLIAGTTVVPA